MLLVIANILFTIQQYCFTSLMKSLCSCLIEDISYCAAIFCSTLVIFQFHEWEFRKHNKQDFNTRVANF